VGIVPRTSDSVARRADGQDASSTAAGAVGRVEPDGLRPNRRVSSRCPASWAWNRARARRSALMPRRGRRRAPASKPATVVTGPGAGPYECEPMRAPGYGSVLLWYGCRSRRCVGLSPPYGRHRMTPRMTPPTAPGLPVRPSVPPEPRAPRGAETAGAPSGRRERAPRVRAWPTARPASRAAASRASASPWRWRTCRAGGRPGCG